MKKITHKQKKNTSRKKLLIVTPYFYPHSGGLENYAHNIAKGLKEKYKWEVVVITSNHENRKYIVETIKGIKIYRLPILFKISNTPINPFWYFSIKKILTFENPDIINAHAPVPFIADITAAVSKNIPFILTYHAGTMKKDKFLFDLLIALYEKLFLNDIFVKSKKIICSSSFVRKTVVKRYSSKSTTISPAVDMSVFKPVKHQKTKSPTVLFIGRHANMYRMKGLYYLIDAIKKVPNASLKVIGEKLTIKEKNIAFVGIKHGKNLVKEIQNANILVLASLAHMESFGMVLIEAMACKVPVIGTRIGGIPEVINDKKDGLIVPPKNSKALEKAINTLIKNPSLGKKMGENGYKKVLKKYTWDKKINETNEIFLQVLF